MVDRMDQEIGRVLAQVIAGRFIARGKRLKAARRLTGQSHENLRRSHVDARRVRMDLIQHDGSFHFEFDGLQVPTPRPAGRRQKAKGMLPNGNARPAAER